MTSILDRVKQDATEAADERWKKHIAQLRYLHHEDEYHRGVADGYDRHPSRFRWWLFGVVCGLPCGALSAWLL